VKNLKKTGCHRNFLVNKRGKEGTGLAGQKIKAPRPKVEMYTNRGGDEKNEGSKHTNGEIVGGWKISK